MVYLPTCLVIFSGKCRYKKMNHTWMLWDTVDLCVDPIMNQTWTVSNASNPGFNWKFMLQNMGWKAHGNLRVPPLCHPPQEIRPY